MIAHPDQPCLFLEVRDDVGKVVEFWKYDVRKATFENYQLDEKWWIQIEDVRKNILFFKLFTEPSSPDKVSLVAFDHVKREVVWWKNNFLPKNFSGNSVHGDEGHLSVDTGEPIAASEVFPLVRNFSTITPLQYFETSGHFQTMKLFLEAKAGITPVSVVEYVEYRQFVIMSTYARDNELANFLIVSDHDGNILLTETLGENLKGIGLDTFFIFDDRLFFVKNRSELVSYSII